MKAKFYIGIISALLLAGSPMAAQFADNDFRNDDAGLVINNYYYDDYDYDYYFASRIKRFHRSYAAFDYYSPVFTETYWYNYQPYSWGISIYGGGGLGFGLGYSYRYPVYNYGWYDPYFGSTWYWDYDPFYYSWYSPVIININFGHRWRHNYWGWYGHDHWFYGHNRWYNNYRPVYHTYNNYYYNTRSGYSSREFPDRKGTSEYNRSNSGGVSRREGTPGSGSRTGTDNNRKQIAPSTVPANRRIEQNAPVRNQGTARTGNTQPGRTQSASVRNMPSKQQVSKGTSSAPERRTAVSSGNSSGSGRTISAPSRSSGTSRTGSKASKGRTSSSKSSSRSSSEGRSRR